MERVLLSYPDSRTQADALRRVIESGCEMPEVLRLLHLALTTLSAATAEGRLSATQKRTYTEIESALIDRVFGAPRGSLS